MPPKAPDYGHREADKELYALIRRLHLSYRQARIGLQDKIEKYLEEFEKKDAEKRALYDSGEMSHEEFIKWRQKMITDTRAWRDMLEQLSDDMTHQNQIAVSMIDDTLPGVYALNHNYGTYEAEVGSGYDTTYTLYDKSTVKRLLTKDEDLLPHPSVPVEKDKLWNKQHLQSAVLQGILTGESMGDIAKRFQSVTDMTERAAMRNARTAVTGAENAGRIDSYIRAQNMGIKMKQMWMATLDARTRDSHAIMDGEQQEVGKKFSNGCRYPGDPQGSPAEVYNCRCTAVAVVEGADPYNPNLRPSEYLKEEGLTYDQWKQMHDEKYYSNLFKDYEEPADNPAAVHQIVNGKDISQTWQRRPDQFAFEIEDVINAQGFDGLPRVVSQAEFSEYVKQANNGNGFIAQRTYSAPDQETLDLYRDQLYHGKWYVDCSIGGAAYGQGMYTAADYTGNLTDKITKEMQDYQRQNLNYAGSKAIAYTETMTLDPSARIIEYKELRAFQYDEVFRNFANQDGISNQDLQLMLSLNRARITGGDTWQEARSSFEKEYPDLYQVYNKYRNKFSDLEEDDELPDIGVIATKLGYDAIRTTHGTCKNDTVILNRTKVIFLGKKQ